LSENLRREIFSLFVCIAYSSHLVWIEVEIRQNKLVRSTCCWKITSSWYSLILWRKTNFTTKTRNLYYKLPMSHTCSCHYLEWTLG